MARYLVAYHGGIKPKGEVGWAKVMQAWQDWAGSMGADLVDPGNSVGMSKTVMRDGSVVDNGGSNPVTGYCMISADSMENALSKARSHSFLDTGGSVEIAEVFVHG